MKKIISTVLAVCLLMSLSVVVSAASTASGTLGAVTWTVEGKTLTIAPTNTTPVLMPDYCATAPWHDYEKTVTRIVVEPGITSIGRYAFWNFTALKSVSLSDDITTINQNAFDSCVSLADITLPENLGRVYYDAFSRCTSLRSIDLPVNAWLIDAFRWCSSLTDINAHPQSENYASVDGILFSKDMTRLLIYPQGKTAKTYTVPSSVTEIGDSAFYGCESLTSVTLPSGLLTIGDNAFTYCSSFSSVSLPDGLTEIGSGAFGWTTLTSIVIPDSVTSVGGFYECTKLKSVTLPEGLDWMPSFQGCTSLTEIDIPDSVAGIDNNGFMDCVSLKSIDLPESLEYIGDYAFYNCSSLKTIHIPAATTQIITLCTFAYCTSLESITVAKSNPNYCAVDGVMFDKDKSYLAQYPPAKKSTSYTIPSTVTDIAMSAFAGSSYLEEVTIPASVTWPGLYLFANCPALKTISVVSSNPELCAVDGVLFTKDKTGLVAYPAAKSGTSYQVPDGVEYIHDTAFSSSKLTSISLPASLNEFEYGAIVDSAIKNVNIDSANTVYASVDGVVFSKDKKTLIYYPAARTATKYTVPAHTTTIGDRAFYLAPNLTEIVVSEGVTTINDYAFRECPRLSSVTLPKSLNQIGVYVAIDSFALEDIYYHGNADNWADLDIDIGYNEELYAADLHYILSQLTNTDCTMQGSVYRFNIHCEQQMTDEFIAVATYDSQGNMTGISLVPCDGSWSYSADIPATGNDSYAKVFVWDSTGSMTPLGEPEDVEL